jgi:hypothetical protein
MSDLRNLFDSLVTESVQYFSVREPYWCEKELQGCDSLSLLTEQYAYCVLYLASILLIQLDHLNVRDGTTGISERKTKRGIF